MRPVAGGMWQHLLTLLDGIRDDYEVVVCCQDDPAQVELLRSQSIPVRTVSMPPTIRPIADFHAFGALRKVVREEKPAIIHSHGFHAGLLTAMVCRFAGSPAHVCTLHSMAGEPAGGWVRMAVYNPLQRVLVRLVPHLVAVSEAVKEALPGRLAAAKVVVIPNGVDPRRLVPTLDEAEARESIELDASHTVVGYVGRLAAEKGVEDLMRMVAIMAGDDDDVRFVIVGDGPLRGELEGLASGLKVGDRVRFVGRRFPASDFMQLFDVTVAPSVSEGQSLVAIESMLMGKPVVATAVGGLAEVVTPDTGVLVPPGNPKELARAVREVLSSGQAARMGRRGRETATKRFSAAEMIRRTKRVYEEALELAQRRR